MKQGLITLFIAFLLCHAVAAQVRVYHVSGEAYSQVKGGLQRLQFRDAVPSAPLVLKPGCQLILLNEKGRTVTYSQAGTVSFAAVQKAFATAPVSLTQAYLTYVWRKMREQPVTVAQQGNRPLGGISRGERLRLWAPADSTVLDQPELTFQWVSEDDGPFLFTITDAASSPLLQLKTPASTLSLNLIRSPLQRNTLYYWSVATVNDPSGNAIRRAFVWPDETLQNQFRPLLPPDSGSLSAAEQQWQAQYRAKWFYEHVKP